MKMLLNQLLLTCSVVQMVVALPLINEIKPIKALQTLGHANFRELEDGRSDIGPYGDQYGPGSYGGDPYGGGPQGGGPYGGGDPYGGQYGGGPSQGGPFGGGQYNGGSNGNGQGYDQGYGNDRFGTTKAPSLFDFLTPKPTYGSYGPNNNDRYQEPNNQNQYQPNSYGQPATMPPPFPFNLFQPPTTLPPPPFPLNLFQPPPTQPPPPFPLNLLFPTTAAPFPFNLLG